MRKFNTIQQLQTAILEAFTLRATVGNTGEVSEKVAQQLLSSGCFKATFWGFDDAGNNIVQFKALT
jgi:hypothetical protein